MCEGEDREVFSGVYHQSSWNVCPLYSLATTTDGKIDRSDGEFKFEFIEDDGSDDEYW